LGDLESAIEIVGRSWPDSTIGTVLYYCYCAERCAEKNPCLFLPLLFSFSMVKAWSDQICGYVVRLLVVMKGISKWTNRGHKSTLFASQAWGERIFGH
jgi:hypothetical protein